MQHGLSVQEARTVLGIGTTKIYELINSGELKARKLGKRTIVFKDDLDAFLATLESFPVKKRRGQ